MDLPLHKLSASELRTMIILEYRKFVLALEYGATLSDLEEIKDHITMLEQLLGSKEQEGAN